MRPRPLEVASGTIFEEDPEAPPLPSGVTARPRDAFEAAIRAALSHPPCLVSFSGGRDSSSVLAAAVSVARRDGLPLPVPITYRFASAPGSQEDEWQETVIRHLGITDWERLSMSSELDSVGPVAQAVLRRHGLLWPFNAHFHAPLLARAAGGALLTGVGGDELLARSRWETTQALLSRRRRPRLRHVATVGFAGVPRRVKVAVIARRHEIRTPWLTPHAEDLFNLSWAGWSGRTPVRWDRGLAWWWRSRYRTVVTASLGALADAADARIVHPFIDPCMVAATARRFGAAGPVDRSTALRELFGDLLPEEILTRRRKAHFDEAFFSDHSRAFVRDWTGDGVDPSLVDAGRLAAEWRSYRPQARSFLLMQVAWLGCAR